jgi:hypothetical protein
MVAARWEVPTIFAVAGASVLIGAAASVFVGRRAPPGDRHIGPQTITV